MSALEDVIRGIVRDEVRAAVAEVMTRNRAAPVTDSGYLSISGAARCVRRPNVNARIGAS